MLNWDEHEKKFYNLGARERERERERKVVYGLSCLNAGKRFVSTKHAVYEACSAEDIKTLILACKRYVRSIKSINIITCLDKNYPCL